ncbi:MAG: phage holin family protein [Solirubrobacteraceae bacterium]
MAVEIPDGAPKFADAASRVVDSTLTIVQQELELARLELVEKLPKLGGGLVRLAISALLLGFGGLLAVLALIWALADYVFGFEHVWASFAVVAAALLLIGSYLAASALRRARAAGPPLPMAALRQARVLWRSLRP